VLFFSPGSSCVDFVTRVSDDFFPFFSALNLNCFFSPPQKPPHFCVDQVPPGAPSMNNSHLFFFFILAVWWAAVRSSPPQGISFPPQPCAFCWFFPCFDHPSNHPWLCDAFSCWARTFSVFCGRVCGLAHFFLSKKYAFPRSPMFHPCKLFSLIVRRSVNPCGFLGTPCFFSSFPNRIHNQIAYPQLSALVSLLPPRCFHPFSFSPPLDPPWIDCLINLHSLFGTNPIFQPSFSCVVVDSSPTLRFLPMPCFVETFAFPSSDLQICRADPTR